MTSRLAPGIQHPRALSGPQRVPNRGRAPPGFNAPPAGRQAEAVIDLTVDDKQAAEDALKGRASSQGAGKASIKTAGADGVCTPQASSSKSSSRGKPQLFFDGPSVSGISNGPERARSAGPAAAGPSGLAPAGSALPLPPRPGIHVQEAAAQTSRTAAPEGSAARRDGVSKIVGLDTPSMAFKFPHSRTVDFFPWTGSHREDTLTRDVVQSGYFDKPTVANEANTARPSLWSHLKNKSGLATLSSLFAVVLEKRQASNRLLAPSTFKLPPRVTLNETRREDWLRDLANPALPLRKLIRTIPHGIRGKLLLEQCLSKSIPTARAVWLAKCVGTNEMRAFKRKGASGTIGICGELKWIREWTKDVEQFVEAIVGNCGQEKWKSQMEYAIRLSSHLFSGHLLDQDHYMDWILASLEGSPIERLPVWLILLEIYWHDLISTRRRGRRLAEGLLEQACTILSAEDKDMYQVILRRLRRLVQNLVISRPSCTILPKSWKKHQHTLELLFDQEQEPAATSAIESILKRNLRLADSSSTARPCAKSPENELVSLLDSVEVGTQVGKLATACRSLLPRTEALVASVLNWAASVYRQGSQRIYLATRLVRIWNASGLDTDEAILKYVATAQDSPRIEAQCIFKIVAELVRSKNFSVGRYFQWLIATGSVGSQPATNERGDYHIRLIAEIPSYDLPAHLLNLRRTILQSVGIGGDEDDVRAKLQAHVAERLAASSESTDRVVRAAHLTLSQASSSVQVEVSRWLREEVASLVVEIDSNQPEDGKAAVENHLSIISPGQFFTVRDVLEEMEDFPILADILGIVSTSRDCSVLTAVADTLNYHHRIFDAIGALAPLFRRLTEQYGSVRIVKLPDRSFLLALADLCCRVDGDAHLIQQLKWDLARSEQMTSLAVCSPASDNMSEFLQSTKIDSVDEIERILASGNSMDEQIMTRVFKRIISHIDGDSNDKAKEKPCSYGSWFHRLRGFDDKVFDRLMNNLVLSRLLNHQAGLLTRSLSAFISSGSLTLDGFLDLSDRCLSSAKVLDEACKIVLSTLDACLPHDTLDACCTVQDGYRYRLEQEKLCTGPKGRILPLIGKALTLCSRSADSACRSGLRSLLHTERLRAVLKRCTINVPESLVDALGLGSSQLDPIVAGLVREILERLLDPYSKLGMSGLAPAAQATKLFQIADDLSLPFCKLQLRFLLKSEEGGSSTDPQASVAYAVMEAAKSSIDSNSAIWAQLILGLHPEIIVNIRKYAENQILNHPSLVGSSQLDDEGTLQKYIRVIDITANDSPIDGNPQFTEVLLGKLNGLCERLSPPEDKPSESDGAQKPHSPPQTADLRQVHPWIHALLHLTLAHRSSFLGRNGSSPLTRLIKTLRSLLLSPSLQNHATTIEYIFDVALCFSDDLPDDSRNQLIKAEMAKPSHDPRVAFILGLTPSPDGWLGLVSAGPGAPTPVQSPNFPARGGPQQQNLYKMSPKQAPMGAQVQRMQPAQYQQSAQQPPRPYQLRRWEMLPDLTSNAGANDTALSLGLFAARRVQ